MTLLTVSGTVFFRERIALPTGALATVKVVNTEGEVLAASAINVSGIPTEFRLTIDPGFVTDPATLLIWAMLRSEVGVWGTTDLVPIDGEATAVMLTKIDD